MLTLFTSAPSTPTRGHDSVGLGAASDGCGAAVSVLCAPAEVASELQRLFLQMAGKLFALECDPRLPHLQLRDVHGFMVLPGQVGKKFGYEQSRSNVILSLLMKMEYAK
jgi:hypothetical protein